MELRFTWLHPRKCTVLSPLEPGVQRTYQERILSGFLESNHWHNWVHYHWFLKRLCKQIDRGLSIDGKLTRIHLCYQGLSEQAYFLQPFIVDGWLPLWVELSKSGQTISRSITQSSKPGFSTSVLWFRVAIFSVQMHVFHFHNHVYRCLDLYVA